MAESTSNESTAAKGEITVGEAGHVLSSGIDTIEISLSIIWKRNDFLKL